MATKVKEIRPVTEQGRKSDPECSTCGSVPKGKISMSDVWARSLRQPTPFKPFTSQGENGPR